jgi:sugar phosphate isomerase/epimerase
MEWSMIAGYGGSRRAVNAVDAAQAAARAVLVRAGPPRYDPASEVQTMKKMQPAGPSGGLPVSRREFLGAAAVLVGAAGGAEALGAEGAAKKDIAVRVGAHPWVYAAKQPNYEITPILPSIFADLEDAGIEGLELMHTALRPKDAVERIGELSRRHRVSVVGASFGGDMWDRTRHAAVLEDAELVIPRLAALGGRTLGTSVGQAPKKKTEEQLDAQAELLRKLIALCGKHGVVLNLHNHTYEVADGLHDLGGTLRRIPDAKLGPDLNWLLRGGVDPAAFLRKHGKAVVFLHLRDQKADGRWSEALGEGDMDYRGIARALEEIRFRGDAVIELAHEGDFKLTRPIRESLRMSREFVRKVLGY